MRLSREWSWTKVIRSHVSPHSKWPCPTLKQGMWAFRPLLGMTSEAACPQEGCDFERECCPRLWALCRESISPRQSPVLPAPDYRQGWQCMSLTWGCVWNTDYQASSWSGLRVCTCTYLYFQDPPCQCAEAHTGFKANRLEAWKRTLSTTEDVGACWLCVW